MQTRIIAIVALVFFLFASAVHADWVPQDSPINDTFYNYNQVFCVDAQNCWIAGGQDGTPVNGRILRTSDGGNTWVVKFFHSGASLQTVFFIDLNKGWAAGWGGTIVHTTDGGETWSFQASGLNPSLFGSVVRAIYFTDANNGWAVGESDGVALVLYTDDGGQTWTRQFTGLSNFFFADIHMVDVNEGWVVGAVGSNQNLILHTTDGGLNWNDESFTLDDTDPRGVFTLFAEVDFVDANHGWIFQGQLSFDGLSFRTTDGGQTWQPISGIVGRVQGGDFINSNEGWVVGAWIGIESRGFIQHSTDGGATWDTQVAFPKAANSRGNRLLDVYAVDSNNAWAVGLDRAIYKYSPDDATPVAEAGPDQTVNEGDLVTLDGSGSNAPANGLLTFTWTQLPGGTAVSLDLTDPIHPIFTAPNVPPAGETLTFQLFVTDGTVDSEPDEVNVTIKNVNNPPTTDAGPDQTVMEGSPVTLDGTGSFDPDGESETLALTFEWEQTAGPMVMLSDATAAQPTFTAPMVGPAGDTLTFKLAVSDGIDEGTDTVVVTVGHVNHPPIANAGRAQTVDEGSLVKLDGRGSSDPDLDPLMYSWSQVGVPAVTLSGAMTVNPSFTAPAVGPGGESLVFELVVNDGLADSLVDSVTITVLDINDPPVCDLAQPSVASLWPPNHKLESVGITEVADLNDDDVSITITGVTQDEPIYGLGDGDTSPDAVLQGGTVLLRAERSGTSNGRVYEIHFTAHDGQGGTCDGSVGVSVPRSKKDTAIDDGQVFDSTLP